MAMTGILDDPEAWRGAFARAIETDCLSVRREYVVGREWLGDGTLDRIDPVLSGPGFVLAIENKIWSAEHDAQTEAYWQWLSSTRGLRAGLYLTPTGAPPSCASFKRVSYLDLIGWLLDAADRQPMSAREEAILGAYVRTLANGVLRAELRALAAMEA
jgi:hypothetical protein